MTEGIPTVKDLLHGLTDSTGREPTFTWLLRADEQVRDLQGEYGWVVRAHSALLRSLQQSGDELGWHPHFWRRDSSKGRWFQELEDLDWQVEMLRQAHRDLTTASPGRGRTGPWGGPITTTPPVPRWGSWGVRAVWCRPPADQRPRPRPPRPAGI